MRIVRQCRAFLGIFVFLLVCLCVMTPHYFAVLAFDWAFGGEQQRYRKRVAAWQSLWAAIMLRITEVMLGIRVAWQLPPEAATAEFSKPLILVANHQSSFDILLVIVLLRRLGHRDVRWLFKREALAIPVVGWSCKETECAALARDGGNDDVVAVKRCARVAWQDDADIAIFPEGTRFTKPKPDSGLMRLLPPKVKGFTLLRSKLPYHSVLSATIRWDDGVASKTMSGVAAIVGKRVIVEAVIAEDIDDPAKWLTEEWRRKDKQLASQDA